MDSGSQSKPAAQPGVAPEAAAGTTMAPVALSNAAATNTDAKPSSDAQTPAAPSPAAPSGASASAPKTATKPKGPPPGYKLIKRRKDDGTFITVMRKMTPEELEAAGQTASSANAATLGGQNPGVKYKVVTVRDANGAWIRVKRPIKDGDDSSPPSSTPAQSAPGTTKAAATAIPASSGENTKPDAESTKKAQEGVEVPSRDGEPKSPSETSKPLVPVDDKTPAPTTASQGEPSVIDEEPIDMAKALAEQKELHRQQRMQRMRGSLLRGFGTILGSTVIDVDDSHHESHHDGGDIQDGDIIDSDQSFSDSDMDDDDHDQASRDNQDNSSTQVHFNAAGAAGSAIAGMAAGPPPRPAPAAAPNSSEKDDPRSKESYKITAKDLEQMEKQAAEKDIEMPLRHHWTNFSFYLMASLSIVLPLLFLVLVIFIFLMNNQSVNSRWNVMPDVIKGAISAWPIVFAAVVAQVFKAYATWKVERGIKLIQLEQLIGSSSFASAVKQPMILRQLDVLSLLLLLTWCLSPFGSQALQRSTTTVPSVITDTISVRYLDQTGNNKVFGINWENNTTPDSDHAADNQASALYFLSTLTAVTQRKLTVTAVATSDQYSHPLLYKPVTENSTNADLWTPISGMGLPVLLPDSQIPDDTVLSDVPSTMTESFSFNATSSYFAFTCGSWSIINAGVISSTYPNMSFSSSKTLAMQFTNAQGTASGINHLRFASANLDTSSNSNITIDQYTTWDYSFIQCNFTQKFIDTNVRCVRSPPGADSLNWKVVTNCYSMFAGPTPDTSKLTGTSLEDFSDDWTMMGSSRNTNKPGIFNTPTEMYAQNGVSNYQPQDIMLFQSVAPADFAVYFGNLFNTWVGVGYCPQCHSITTNLDYNSSAANIQSLYKPVDAERAFTGEDIYAISIPWLVCFIICTVLLLIAGVVSVVVESITVAPDTLGYVSTVARNSRYLHVKPTSGAMTGPERARKLADTEVMIQDVKANAGVGKIALGLKSDKAVRLQVDRLYR